MTTPCFPPGTQITFALEPEDPYTVRCASPRYAILTRPFTSGDVETFGLTAEDCKDCMGRHMIYSIVDAEQKIRGKNHFVFNHYEYETDEGCQQCLEDMISGECEISRRNSEQYTILSQSPARSPHTTSTTTQEVTP